MMKRLRAVSCAICAEEGDGMYEFDHDYFICYTCHENALSECVKCHGRVMFGDSECEDDDDGDDYGADCRDVVVHCKCELCEFGSPAAESILCLSCYREVLIPTPFVDLCRQCYARSCMNCFMDIRLGFSSMHCRGCLPVVFPIQYKLLTIHVPSSIALIMCEYIDSMIPLHCKRGTSVLHMVMSLRTLF
jgi:hypothetical protein